MSHNNDNPKMLHKVYNFKQINEQFAAYDKVMENCGYHTTRVLRRLKDNPLEFLKKTVKWAIRKIESVGPKLLSTLGLQVSAFSKNTAFETFLIKNGFDLAVKGIRERKNSGL